MPTKFNPIANAVILDTETIGIGVGSPVHEVSLYDVHTRSGYQFLMNPNFAVKQGFTPGVDVKRMTTSGKDYIANFYDIGFESGRTTAGSTTPTLSPEDAKRLAQLESLNSNDELIQGAIKRLRAGESFTKFKPSERMQVSRGAKKLGSLSAKEHKAIFTLTKAEKQGDIQVKAKNITTLAKIHRETLGRPPTWGDTIVARAIYNAELDAMSKAGGSKQAYEAARIKTLRALEEMAYEGGIEKVIRGEGVSPEKQRNIISKVAKGDAFFYEKVLKPLGFLKDGTRAAGTTDNIQKAFLAYPYLSKIFDQSVEGMSIQQKIASPLVSNLQTLAVAENVSLQALLTGKDIDAREINRRTMDVLTRKINFTEIMRGKAIWIANANFESKIFGSHAMALEAEFTDQGVYAKSLYTKYKQTRGKEAKRVFIDEIKEGVKSGRFTSIRNIVVGGTSPYTADMFTISNERIAEAKARAQTGVRGASFRGVFRAYRDYMTGGDVGDILDIVKSHQSYLISMGKTSTSVKKPLTLSIDVAYRLYRAAEVGAATTADESLLMKQDKVIKALFEAETHRAFEDTTVEDYVLRKSWGMSEFYEENLRFKGKLSKLYAHGTVGSMSREAKIFHYLYNRAAPEVQKMQFEKRLLSAIEDINQKGYTTQTTGRREIGKIQRLVPVFDEAGEFVDFDIKRITTSYTSKTKGKVRLKTIPEVISHIFGDISTHSRAVDPNYAPIISSLRTAATEAGEESLSDAELLRRYSTEVVERLNQEGISQKPSVSVADAQGPNQFNADKIAKYQMKLSHRTDEIMARVAGMDEDELRVILRGRDEATNLAYQAKNIIEDAVDKPPIAIVDASELFDDIEPPKPPPPPPPPKPQSVQPSPSIGRVISGGVADVFGAASDIRYEQALKTVGDTSYLDKTAVSAFSKRLTLEDIGLAKRGSRILAGMGAVGFIGSILDGFSDGSAAQKEGINTLRTMNYQKWLTAQKQFSGMSDERRSEGMSHSGISSILRRFGSDFGSPYQGPAYSFAVFEQQQLLKERETYLRSRFGRSHYTSEGNIGRIFEKIRLGSITSRLAQSGGMYDNYNLGYGVEGNYTLAGVKRDVNLVKLNLENYRIQVSDADTITLQRKGPRNGLTSFFGMNEKPISIRLAGIDAPETAHGDRAAQPFGNEAKSVLQAMLSGSKNISIYVDRGNVTYGRQVGHVFADDKNLSLEMLKRGYVSYLPFKGKGAAQTYDSEVFSSASKLAQGNSYAMWGTPYFQAYRDVVKSSGMTVTFNTLVNIEKVSKNSNLMNLYSLMNYAEQSGMYNSAMSMEAASIGADIREKGLSPDYKSPIFLGSKTAAHKSYRLELLSDMAKMLETKGGKLRNKLKVREVSRLNKSMAIDSTGVTTSIYNKRKMHAQKIYRADSSRRVRRRESMAVGQKAALREMKAGPIGHFRM